MWYQYSFIVSGQFGLNFIERSEVDAMVKFAQVMGDVGFPVFQGGPADYRHTAADIRITRFPLEFTADPATEATEATDSSTQGR